MLFAAVCPAHVISLSVQTRVVDGAMCSDTPVEQVMYVPPDTIFYII